MLIEGHKESAPAVHIPKAQASLPQLPHTMKYAQTDTPIQAYLLRLRFIVCMSIVIGRDLRALESLSNQILYLIEPTMSCKVAHTPNGAQLAPQCICKDTK